MSWSQHSSAQVASRRARYAKDGKRPHVWSGALLSLLGALLMCVVTGLSLLGAFRTPEMGLEVVGLADVWIPRIEENEISHQFVLVNRGKKPIHIIDIHRSCTCMVSRIQKGRALAPGEKLPIDVTMRTVSKVGELQESIRLVTDSPMTPALHLTIGGVVPPRPQVSYRPHRLFFQSADESRTIYMVVPLLYGYHAPEFWKRSSWIEADVREIASNQKYTQYAVEVRLNGLPATDGVLEGEFGLNVQMGPDGFRTIPVVFRPTEMADPVTTVSQSGSDERPQ